jgi:hypothetical protein
MTYTPREKKDAQISLVTAEDQNQSVDNDIDFDARLTDHEGRITTNEGDITTIEAALPDKASLTGNNVFSGNNNFSNAPIIAGYTMPGADGTPGQVLTTNGSGTAYFATPVTGGGGFDIVITNQTEFNNLFVRTAANQYDINGSYKTVYIKVGTYDFTSTGALSGGDTWGSLNTNSCRHFYCEPGTIIDVGANESYMNVETSYCQIENVQWNGLASSAAAISRSFLTGAQYITYKNCSSADRQTNVDMRVFEGSGISANDSTTVFENCEILNIISTSGLLYGFDRSQNMRNCKIEGLLGTAAVTGFASVVNAANCKIDDITSAGDVRGFDNGFNLTCCLANDLEATGAFQVYGFSGTYLSNCRATTIANTGTGNAYGFSSANHASNCSVDGLSSTVLAVGFQSCEYVSNSEVANLSGLGHVRGFSLCLQVSSSKANGQTMSGSGTNVGFYFCFNITACRVKNLLGGIPSAYFGCEQIAGCAAETIDCTIDGLVAAGFSTCKMISACYANDIDAAGTSSSYGFVSNLMLGECFADNINSVSGTAENFNGNVYVSSVDNNGGNNTGNNFVDTADTTPANQESCINTNWT